MAINKKLIHFQTLANFEAQLSAGNILDTSICFIKDANKIWTHGQFYDCDVQIMNDGGEGRVVLGHNNQTIYPYTLASQVQAGELDLDTYLNNLADVATSGSYNDLKNKPTIPSAVTESTVSGWGFTKNTGTYSKPSTGIPKTDLASAVQTSLGKADTALQSYTEQYKGTVTGVKINGTTKNPSSGVVDLGTVITAHQTLKTINGESIVGSGDITISGGSSNANVQAVDTGDVLDDVTVEYVTKTYFDSVVGDINGILESIIYTAEESVITIVPNTTYEDLANSLINKYGTSYGTMSTPLSINAEDNIYLQGFSQVGDGKVEYLHIDSSAVYLYLSNHTSTYYCVRIDLYSYYSGQYMYD